MPRKPTGSVFYDCGSAFARLTVAPNVRRAFKLASAGEDEARARADVLAELAAQLRPIGQPDLTIELLQAGADAREGAELLEVVDTVRRLVAGELRIKPTATMTFKQLGEMWTSGQLADRWPDHVKRKRTAHRDAGLLEARVYPLVGSVPLVDFTLEHAERVMRSLPSMESATRRQHAQAIARVLALAAYPVRAIERSPIPRGFVPPQRSNKALAYLYPDEDRALLACAAVPLGCRVLYALLDREGMREGEARALTWTCLDLERGAVRLDENKTDDPRAWALNPGVTRALAAWRRLLGGPSGEALVFEGSGFDWHHAARTFRGHLTDAGVTRAELFLRSASRLPIRIHDLRGTFVTLALACGRSETWVADRTGHRSSAMINRYRRTARTASELGLGELAPMDEAIPELGPETAGETAGTMKGDAGAETEDRDKTGRKPGWRNGIRRRLKSADTRTDQAPAPESPEVSHGGGEPEEPPARVPAVSNASPAVSRSLRADAIEALGGLAGKLGAAGDVAAARTLERALRELLGDASSVPGEGAEIVDLASRRDRRPPR